MKKKQLLLLFTCAVVLICAAIFSQRTVIQPDTNLEFWICDNVDDFDFSEYRPRFGLMGGREYYGKGYLPAFNENREQIDPEHCVIYTVTAYPDYASGKSHITRITISDPDVHIWGLTVNASSTDIMNVMERNGFRHTASDTSAGLTYTRGKVSIRFSRGSITVSVKVTNFFGIQF